MALVTGSRQKVRWLLTFKGVVYGSLAWPVFAVIVLMAATWYTERPGWRPPEVRRR